MTKQLPIVLFLGLAGLGLAACGQKAPQQAPQTGTSAANDITTHSHVVHYLCGGGRHIAVRYDDSQDAVELYLGSVALQLKHVASADGARFSDGLTTFWDKGKGALLELGASPEPLTCIRENEGSPAQASQPVPAVPAAPSPTK